MDGERSYFQVRVLLLLSCVMQFIYCGICRYLAYFITFLSVGVDLGISKRPNCDTICTRNGKSLSSKVSIMLFAIFQCQILTQIPITATIMKMT